MPPENTPERRAQSLTDICIEQGRQQERLRNLEEWQKTQNGTLKEILKEIKGLQKLLLARPAWYYWVIVVGLAVTVTYLFTRAFP